MINVSKLYCGLESESDRLRYGAHKARAASEIRPVVVWNVSRRCNLRCIHCYSDSENRRYDGELTKQEAERMLTDLAGFGVGIIEKDEIIDGRHTKKGDIVLGLESSGVHSNGYSLIRRVFSQKELKLYAKELLIPTRLYPKPVLTLKKKIKIKGIANITGGAFYDKIPRIIPKSLAIEIYKDSWQVPWVFSLIKKKGKVDDKEMYRALNMGIGMVHRLRK